MLSFKMTNQIVWEIVLLLQDYYSLLVCGVSSINYGTSLNKEFQLEVV